MSRYAWMIMVDHLAEDGEDSEAGTTGPYGADPADLAALTADHGDTFKMYDDDGILYYTGKAVATEWDEDACYGPLGDFGMPNAGAVRIDWPGHPERDCG